MRRTSRFLATAAATAVAVALPSIALAHPDHGERDSGSSEQFPGEGVDSSDKQHDGTDGHLPARSDNVTLVGKGAVSHPGGADRDITGRVADVFAYGDYAYLNAFRGPACDAGGVHVMDISDLADPVEVPGSFLPTSPGSYAGEGIQVLRIGDRDVLIHQNETCPGPTPPPGTSGGINLWDVTDPLSPTLLEAHAGDYSGGPTGTRSSANTVHSVYAWTNVFDGRTYAVLVDNAEFADVDIMDITDPANPVMVNDTLDLVDLFGVDQDSPKGLASIFNHDMQVENVGARYVMNVGYWDGGYVLLDVTDPRPGKVSLIAESDYAALDEERLARGHAISPEGNAHQSELSPNGRFLVGTDEDFAPFRGVATIDSGRYAGTTYTTATASGTPPITDEAGIQGVVDPVGLACSAVPAGDGVALVERGSCSFQTKLNNIKAAGYDAGIVFNNTIGCDALVRMAASGDIPFVFVTRTTGLQLLDVADVSNPCTTAAPADAEGQATTVTAVFDGWGYVRLFEVDIPKGTKGGAGSIRQIDTYAIEESQDKAFAEGFGDLSVHEVALDPEENLAYFSYYAGGLRIATYGKQGLQEVGAFIDEGGNNFWGIETYERDGQTYLLASDRDHGLYVFQYTP